VTVGAPGQSCTHRVGGPGIRAAVDEQSGKLGRRTSSQEASFVPGIEIHRDRRKGVLGLSQKAHLEKVLKKFSMHACNPTPAPIVKGDKYGSFQSPKNQYEIDQMKSVLYASVVGSLMYAQVCTHPDLTFVIGMLSRYQKNPGVSH
jgi:hypothetical protein